MTIALQQLAAAVALAVATAGCSHYSLGATPEPTDGAPSRPVDVATVGVPADWGIDGARLTRQLVRELQTRGVEGANWRGTSDPAAFRVRCAVSGPEPVAFGLTFTTRIHLRCKIGGGETHHQIRVSGRAALTGPSARSRPPDLRRTAVEAAAVEAVAQAAGVIARRLSGDPSRPIAANEPSGVHHGQTTR